VHTGHPLPDHEDPSVLLLKWLGQIDRLGAIIVPSFVTPFAVFLLRQFFLSLPREIE
jgi:multiple sugar transport system permease protein